MPLSKKSKKARTVAALRKKESSETRLSRLEKMKEYATNARAREDYQSKEKRLSSQREYARKVRSSESRASREMRLTAMRDHASQVRDLESPQTREMRLETMRTTASQVRDLESPQTRDMRLKMMRDHASQVRELESPQTRDMRLKMMRDHASQVRELESPQTRDMRLEMMRDHASQVRELESSQTREMRLEMMRDHASQVRDLESPQTREMRLEMMRDHASQVRVLESPQTREMRLEMMRDHASQVRDLESPQTREMRLEMMRDHASQVRDLESPQTREMRLEMMRDHASQVRDAESPPSREVRLHNMRCVSRDAYMRQRDLFTTDSRHFLDAISQVADQVCYVCKQMKFKNQTKQLRKVQCQLLPEECPESFVVCNRCYSSLTKNKIPTTAYWNNMNVSTIPEELRILSEMELRLISRIRPFLKVVKLGGRFGQKGFKGQAILFAQQVEELAEQLPLSFEQSGLTIVVEKLDNVNITKQYEVNLNNIRNALTWLQTNNHLYANVRVNFSHLSNEVNCNIVEIPAIVENENNIQNHYQEISNSSPILFILRGSFHQGSDIFGSTSRGKQCTANATAAIAYSSSNPLQSWKSSDIDRVLIFGDKYYKICLENLDIHPDYLATDELLPYITIADKSYTLDFEVDAAVGLVYTTGTILSGYFRSIKAGLENLFQRPGVTSCIVTCNEISVAVITQNGRYYLFDSHSRGPKGRIAPSAGRAMVMIFPTLDTLSKQLHFVLGVTSRRQIQFSLTTVKSQLMGQTDESLDHELVLPPMNLSIPEESQSNMVNQSGSDDITINTTLLMPIDVPVPDIAEVILCQNETDNDTLPIREIKRKTAPPVSVLIERRAEELTWVKLFPDGKNGLNEERPSKITPLDYFQARVMGNDKRFQTIEYLFYALSVVELLRARQNVSVCGRLRQDGAQPSDLFQNIHLCMRNIRGTSSYWHKSYSELMAMVRNLGPPHWYITLSCNDLNWPDMLHALLVTDGKPNVTIEDLTFEEKVRLVESYPITVSRQFMFRLNALLRLLKAESIDPLLGRNVADYWWRIEFQLRGSPHVHMLVWCKDMPDFNSPIGTALIENVITCKLPAEDELKDLVRRLQTHHHTTTCYKKNNSNTCRFGFPRPVSETTRILDDQQATKNGGRFYELKRDEAEIMINNYNLKLLMLWRANIDIQPVVSAVGVAMYIAKYIAKSEPTQIQAAITGALNRIHERGGNFQQQIFAVQSALLSHRQVSASECAFRLCHLRLREGSRKCVFVNTCKPQERYRMLRFDTDCPEPYKNIFDRYENRPRSLENISLGEFAVSYEPLSSASFGDDENGDEDAYEAVEEESPQIITLLNRMGRMRKRRMSAILRTRYYTAASDPEAYYYSLLVAHCPFRVEDELLANYDSAKEAFLAKRSALRPLQQGSNIDLMNHWEEEIQDALRRVTAENAAELCENDINADLQQPYILDPETHIHLDVPDVNEEVTEPVNIVMNDEEFLQQVRCLNMDQKRLFSLISQKIGNQTTLDDTALRVFVTGGAGSGKSFTLKLIVEQIRRLSNDRHSVVIAAPTGVAARLVGGCTLHSTFSLPIEKGRVITMRSLSGDRLQRERVKWKTIDWLIIDEISMVPYQSLRNIHIRLQEIKQSDDFFGGVNIMLFGDIMQLPPVAKMSGGSYCFRQPDQFSAEPHLWRLFSFIELRENMRQGNDTTFVDILNNIRVGQLTVEQLSILDSRRLQNAHDHENVIRIYPTIKQVDQYNQKMSENLSKVTKIYEIQAVDISTESKTYGRQPQGEHVPSDPNKTGGLVNKLHIGVGSRVMLRQNLNISRGLVNGAMGTVMSVDWPALRRDQLEPGELPAAVHIQFDDSTIKPDNNVNNTVQITPSTAEYDGLRGSGKILRKMLPLILCWGVTVHKLQGCTLEKAVVDVGKRIFSKGQVYVALSRVKTLEGLYISDLDPRKLLYHPHDATSLTELERLRNLDLAQ